LVRIRASAKLSEQRRSKNASRKKRSFEFQVADYTPVFGVPARHRVYPRAEAAQLGLQLLQLIEDCLVPDCVGQQGFDRLDDGQVVPQQRPLVAPAEDRRAALCAGELPKEGLQVGVVLVDDGVGGDVLHDDLMTEVPLAGADQVPGVIMVAVPGRGADRLGAVRPFGRDAQLVVQELLFLGERSRIQQLDMPSQHIQNRCFSAANERMCEQRNLGLYQKTVETLISLSWA